MLLSATIVFFPLVSIGGIEISIKSAIQSVYSGSPSYKSIKNILVTGSVKQESEVSDSKTTRKAHGITRGADYYRR